MRLFGWFRAPAVTPLAPQPGLEERIEELEDRYRRLTRRFDRLHGEFSALERYRDEEEDEDDDEEDIRAVR